MQLLSAVIMEKFPEVAVIIPTYNRAKMVVAAINALDVNLLYQGNISYWVGVDGDDNTPDVLRDVKNLRASSRIHILNGPRKKTGIAKGLGANLNMLIQASASAGIDIIIQMDDDHILMKSLQICEHVSELVANPAAGWIRLMGIGYHPFTADLVGHYWYVRWNSEFLYIPSNRPHIKHIRFHTFFGMYAEGMKLGETEEAFCHQCIDKVNKMKNKPDTVIPKVLVPLNCESETAWDHIGHSWQLQGE